MNSHADRRITDRVRSHLRADCRKLLRSDTRMSTNRRSQSMRQLGSASGEPSLRTICCQLIFGYAERGRQSATRRDGADAET